MVRQKLENGAMHGVRKIKDMKKCRKLEKSKKISMPEKSLNSVVIDWPAFLKGYIWFNLT